MKIAVIGGTGLYELDGLSFEQELTIENQWGAISGKIKQFGINEHDVYFLARHGGDHSIPPHKVNYRANIWALKELGVEQIIAVNAVGGITSEMQSEVISIADQIIDYTSGRDATFFDGPQVEHVDFSYPYTESLRQRLIASAKTAGVSVVEQGVYGATNGPRLETIAEINRMERDGCDLVGMTGMPEAVLAREVGLAYACVCLVVNPAAGKSADIITMDEIHQAIDNGMGNIRTIIAQYLSE